MEDDLETRIEQDLEDLKETLKGLSRDERKKALHYYIMMVQDEMSEISLQEYNEFVKAFDDFENGD